jgi:hypothetical protein
VPVGFECATASLAVIAVLVQASRKRAGVDAIVAAMEFLGQCGIRPDAETMEVILCITFLTKSFSCVLNCMQ